MKIFQSIKNLFKKPSEPTYTDNYKILLTIGYLNNNDLKVDIKCDAGLEENLASIIFHLGKQDLLEQIEYSLNENLKERGSLVVKKLQELYINDNMMASITKGYNSPVVCPTKVFGGQSK